VDGGSTHRRLRLFRLPFSLGELAPYHFPRSKHAKLARPTSPNPPKYPAGVIPSLRPKQAILAPPKLAHGPDEPSWPPRRWPMASHINRGPPGRGVMDLWVFQSFFFFPDVRRGLPAVSDVSLHPFHLGPGQRGWGRNRVRPTASFRGIPPSFWSECWCHCLTSGFNPFLL